MTETAEIPQQNLIQDFFTTVANDQEVNPQIIEDILELYTPDQLTRAVIAHPPKLKVGLIGGEVLQPQFEITPPPPQDEHYLAITPDDLPNLPPLDEGGNAIIIALRDAQNYLKIPRINDGFENHNKRREWEKPFLAALAKLDKAKGLNQKDRKEYISANSYAKNFKEIWDNNKYTRSKMATISSAFYIVYFSEQDKLTDSQRERLEDLISRFESLDITERKTDTGKYIDPLESKTPQEMEETVEKVENMARETLDIIQELYS